MSPTPWLRVGLVLLGGSAIPAAIAWNRPPAVEAEEMGATAPVPADTLPPPPFDSLGQVVIQRNPFRLGRVPADIPFTPIPPEAVYVEPPPPKPQLVLSGIVWGEEPSALVEGLPGVEGVRLMRVGDSIGTIRLRRVTRTEATLAGMDTTWVLQVRKPW